MSDAVNITTPAGGNELPEVWAQRLRYYMDRAFVAEEATEIGEILLTDLLEQVTELKSELERQVQEAARYKTALTEIALTLRNFCTGDHDSESCFGCISREALGGTT